MKFDGLMLLEDDNKKFCVSSDYNFVFNKKTGYFARWGVCRKDDPKYAPSPEIADIEITTICNGINGRVCPFCYKSNTPNGKNMSFETFKKIFHKFPKTLNQIAFGVDSHATSNPDTFKIMEYTRRNGVIPNLTVAQIDDSTANKISIIAGSCAVSRYADKNPCYDSVKKLTDRGLYQTNIHCMISEETYDQTMETLHDILTDSRLERLNAVLFLSLKQKGRGSQYSILSPEKFKKIVSFATENEISFGFDSCSTYKYLKFVESESYFDTIQEYCEPCESSLFSIYINVDGYFVPCSFSDGEDEWDKGIDVVNCNDFVQDIWMNEKTIRFRERLLATESQNNIRCRECPIYKV